eukprot:1064553-Amorphochlora_amoeboformis.AAC.1
MEKGSGCDSPVVLPDLKQEARRGYLDRLGRRESTGERYIIAEEMIDGWIDREKRGDERERLGG